MGDTKAKRCCGCGVLTHPYCLQYVDDLFPACCKTCEAEIVGERHDDEAGDGEPCGCECCKTWRGLLESRRRAKDARAFGGLSSAGANLFASVDGWTLVSDSPR